MTSSASDPVTDAERLLGELGADLTDPLDTECLYHYLLRMLDAFGCAGHRFTERWARDRRVRGRPVLRWAMETGGCCCDCEVVFNSLGRRSTRRRGLLCAEALAALESADAQRW
ncbi:MAG: DUF2695 domain-containing protein [Mycobacteriales bacterium]